MVSIIYCGRNDNHNGDFDERALRAQKWNYELLRKSGIIFEFIYIEWNPLHGKTLFAEHLRKIIPDLNVYVVSKEIHTHLCDNPKIGLMQFLAKNTGVRRASYDHLIITNADTYFTDDIISRLKEKKVNEQTLYIYERLNVNNKVLNEEFSIESIYDPENIVFKSTPDIPYYFGAAGDLMLLKKSFFIEMEGFIENIRFSNVHIDTLFCTQILTKGGEIRVDGSVYHVDHQDSWSNDKDGHSGKDYDYRSLSLPYKNNINWGLKNASESIVGDNVFLKLNEDLRETVPETPIIPDNFTSRNLFQEHFDQALDFIKKFKLKTIIYGYGSEAKLANESGKLEKINLVGILSDDSKNPLDHIKLYNWDSLSDVNFDAILIGSKWWSCQLYEKTLEKLQIKNSCLSGSQCLIINQNVNKNIVDELKKNTYESQKVR